MSIVSPFTTGKLPTRKFIVLIALFFSLECSKGNGIQQIQEAAQHPSTCGQAQTEALHFALGSHYEDALQRYHDALDLCRDSKKTMYHVLHGIANIAFRDSSRCQEARDLFRLVPESQNLDHLRNLAWLDYVCPTGDEDRRNFEKLVDAENKAFDTSRGTLLRQLVIHYEHAILFFWTRKPSGHLLSLKNATLEICSEEVFPLAIRILQDENDRENNPVWGTLGFWSQQLPGSVDESSRSCLARIAAKMDATLDDFPGNTRLPAKSWLHWYRTRLLNH